MLCIIKDEEYEEIILIILILNCAVAMILQTIFHLKDSVLMRKSCLSKIY